MKNNDLYYTTRMAMVQIICLGATSIVLLIVGSVLACRIYFGRIKRKELDSCSKSIGFFHPHCASGGGGERVLWSAINLLAQIDNQRLLLRQDRLRVVIYTVDPDSNPKYSQGGFICFDIFLCVRLASKNH